LRRNCLLKHVIEGKDLRDVKTKRRRKQLLDDVKETRGHWKLTKEALAGTVRTVRCGRAYGAFVGWSAE